ncbi:hypothetical protein NDU88_005026 [Pleurodeles waltl]|uniref:Uncharacterized protein n=1 Tax=Pleurodeles waltl TaxID=8319 RepID=A0AAV7TAT2_PLEWA|nr:hypothetical protein NDU88_005026 [Pleurodeles waltl]
MVSGDATSYLALFSPGTCMAGPVAPGSRLRPSRSPAVSVCAQRPAPPARRQLTRRNAAKPAPGASPTQATSQTGAARKGGRFNNRAQGGPSTEERVWGLQTHRGEGRPACNARAGKPHTDHTTHGGQAAHTVNNALHHLWEVLGAPRQHKTSIQPHGRRDSRVGCNRHGSAASITHHSPPVTHTTRAKVNLPPVREVQN